MTNLFFIIWKNKVNSRRTGVTRFTEQTHSSSSRAASGAERRLLLESSEGLAASSAAFKERFCRAEKRVLFLFGSDGAASRFCPRRAERPRAPLPRGFGAQTAAQRRVAAASDEGTSCGR